MGVKISDLPASSGAALSQEFEINNSGTSERLSLAQIFALSTGAVTTDTLLLNFAQTWNNAGATFCPLRFNFTDTASGPSTRIFDFSVSGVTQCELNKAGTLRGVTLRAGVAGSYVSLFTSGFPTVGASGTNLYLFDNGFALCDNSARQFRFGSAAALAWSSAGANLTHDLTVYRDAANVLAQRNGTSAQTFRLYNTFTDASNYERGGLRWSSNELQFFTDNLGTGASRDLGLAAGNIKFYPNGGLAWQFNSSKHLVTALDNSYDIGAAGATRPRTVYAATSVRAPLFQGISGARISEPGDGMWTLGNQFGTDFDRLQFGGTTNAFPALKRSGTGLQVRLADDTGYGDLTAQTLNGIGSLKVNGTQVAGPRVAGWAAATGTATRTTFVTGSVTLPVLAEHVKALIDDLTTHGLIGP